MPDSGARNHPDTSPGKSTCPYGMNTNCSVCGETSGHSNMAPHYMLRSRTIEYGSPGAFSNILNCLIIQSLQVLVHVHWSGPSFCQYNHFLIHDVRETVTEQRRSLSKQFFLVLHMHNSAAKRRDGMLFSLSGCGPILWALARPVRCGPLPVGSFLCSQKKVQMEHAMEHLPFSSWTLRHYIFK
jgi:hypothetical protein